MYNGYLYALLRISASAILVLVDGKGRVVAERNENTGAYMHAALDFLLRQLVRIFPATFPSLCSAIGYISITP